jgi:hypothetical protein
MDPNVIAAIGGIAADAWTTIEYTDAVRDPDTGRWVSRAQVAEVPFAAFSSHKNAERITGRLVVRRIPDLNPPGDTGQDTLFDLWRFHTFLTASDLDTVTADKVHRHHAIIGARAAGSCRGLGGCRRSRESRRPEPVADGRLGCGVPLLRTYGGPMIRVPRNRAAPIVALRRGTGGTKRINRDGPSVAGRFVAASAAPLAACRPSGAIHSTGSSRAIRRCPPRRGLRW